MRVAFTLTPDRRDGEGLAGQDSLSLLSPVLTDPFGVGTGEGIERESGHFFFSFPFPLLGSWDPSFPYVPLKVSRRLGKASATHLTFLIEMKDSTLSNFLLAPRN